MPDLIIVTPFLLEPVDALIVIVVAASWVFVLYAAAAAMVSLARGLRGIAPPPLRPLLDWLAGSATAIENWAREQAAERLLPITHLLRHLDNRLRRYLEAQTGTHNRTLAALRRLRFDVIPRIEAALIVFVQQRTGAVLSFVQAVERQLLTTIEAVRREALSYTTSRTDALLRTLAVTRAELLADDRAVIAYAQSLTASAILRADQDFERAVKLAQLDDQAVITYAQSLATQSQAYARQLVQNQQRRSDAQVAQAERDAVAIGSAVLTLTMTAVAQLAQRVTRLEDSSCQQKCETLGDVGNALDALDLAAILALIGYAAADERGAEHLLADVIRPVAREGAAAFKLLTGR